MTQVEYTATTPVYDVPEVARLLKCSTDTVYDLINAGRLRALRLGKQRAIRISAKALEAFINSQ